MLATSRRLASAASSSSIGGPGMSSAASASSSSSSSSSAALTSKLLMAALPHIPQHGFTPSAVLAGVAHSWPTTTTTATTTASTIDEDALRNLFPGPPTSATSLPIRLFQRWDAHQLLQVKSAGAYHRQDPTAHAKQQQQQPTPEQSYPMAIRVLQRRLESSSPVREHLIHPLSCLSAVTVPSPVTLALTQLLRMRLPFPVSLPDSIPNPVPLLTRAGEIADESCAIARHNAGHGPEWYTARTRLAVAYLIGELHLLAPSSTLQDSSNLLHKVAHVDPQDPTLVNDLGRSLTGSREWIEWGGRAWRGILRSQGLG